MIMEMTRTQITFPVEIRRPQAREEAIWVVRLLCHLESSRSALPLLLDRSSNVTSNVTSIGTAHL